MQGLPEGTLQVHVGERQGPLRETLSRFEALHSFLCIGVHRGILAMPQTIPIRIYVKPYVRKYVLARLCQPDRLLLDEGAQALWDTLERSLSGRTLVQVVNDYDPLTDRPVGYLVLLVIPKDRQQADISHWHHRTVTR
jgi:hypothetical protein